MSAKAVRSPLASTYNMKTVFESPGGIVESHKWCGHFCFWGVWICSRPGHTHSGRKQHLRSGGLTCHEVSLAAELGWMPVLRVIFAGLEEPGAMVVHAGAVGGGLYGLADAER